MSKKRIIITVFLLLVIVGFFLAGLLFYRYKYNQPQPVKVDVTQEEENWVEKFLEENKIDTLSGLGIKGHPADPNLLVIEAEFDSYSKGVLVLRIEDSTYKVRADESMPVLVIQEGIEQQEQLERLTSESLQDLKPKDHLIVNVTLDENKELKADTISKHIFNK